MSPYGPLSCAILQQEGCPHCASAARTLRTNSISTSSLSPRLWGVGVISCSTKGSALLSSVPCSFVSVITGKVLRVSHCDPTSAFALNWFWLCWSNLSVSARAPQEVLPPVQVLRAPGRLLSVVPGHILRAASRAHSQLEHTEMLSVMDRSCVNADRTRHGPGMDGWLQPI